jgi:hypothetical protein
MQADIPGALRDLKTVADRIEELLEWEKLAQQERRPHVPPAFQLREHLPTEIVGLYSVFLTLSESAHRALDQANAPDACTEVADWRKTLQQLEQRVSGWRISARFIKP